MKNTFKLYAFYFFISGTLLDFHFLYSMLMMSPQRFALQAKMVVFNNVSFQGRELFLFNLNSDCAVDYLNADQPGVRKNLDEHMIKEIRLRLENSESCYMVVLYDPEFNIKTQLESSKNVHFKDFITGFIQRSRLECTRSLIWTNCPNVIFLPLNALYESATINVNPLQMAQIILVFRKLIKDIEEAELHSGFRTSAKDGYENFRKIRSVFWQVVEQHSGNTSFSRSTDVSTVISLGARKAGEQFEDFYKGFVLSRAVNQHPNTSAAVGVGGAAGVGLLATAAIVLFKLVSTSDKF